MPNDNLVLQGLLRLKDGFFGHSKKFFRLEGVCLNYYGSVAEADSDPLGSIPLINASFTRNGDRFQIETPTRTFYLLGRTPSESASWVRALKNAQNILKASSSQPEESIHSLHEEELRRLTSSSQQNKSSAQVPVTQTTPSNTSVPTAVQPSPPSASSSFTSKQPLVIASTLAKENYLTTADALLLPQLLDSESEEEFKITQQEEKSPVRSDNIPNPNPNPNPNSNPQFNESVKSVNSISSDVLEVILDSDSCEDIPFFEGDSAVVEHNVKSVDRKVTDFAGNDKVVPDDKEVEGKVPIVESLVKNDPQENEKSQEVKESQPVINQMTSFDDFAAENAHMVPEKEEASPKSDDKVSETTNPNPNLDTNISKSTNPNPNLDTNISKSSESVEPKTEAKSEVQIDESPALEEPKVNIKSPEKEGENTVEKSEVSSITTEQVNDSKKEKLRKEETAVESTSETVEPQTEQKDLPQVAQNLTPSPLKEPKEEKTFSDSNNSKRDQTARSVNQKPSKATIKQENLVKSGQEKVQKSRESRRPEPIEVKPARPSRGPVKISESKASDTKRKSASVKQSSPKSTERASKNNTQKISKSKSSQSLSQQRSAETRQPHSSNPIKTNQSKSDSVTTSKRRTEQIVPKQRKPRPSQVIESPKPEETENLFQQDHGLVVELEEPGDVTGFFSSKRGKKGTIPNEIFAVRVSDIEFVPSRGGWQLSPDCRSLLGVARFPICRRAAAVVVPVPKEPTSHSQLMLRRDPVSLIWEVFSNKNAESGLDKTLQQAQSDLISEKHVESNPLSSIEALSSSEPDPIAYELLQKVAELHTVGKVSNDGEKIYIVGSSPVPHQIVQLLYKALSTGLKGNGLLAAVDLWTAISDSKLPAVKTLVNEVSGLALPRMPKFEQGRMKCVLLLRLSFNSSRLAVLLRALAADVVLLGSFWSHDAPIRNSAVGHYVAVAEMLDSQFSFNLPVRFKADQDVTSLKTINNYKHSTKEEGSNLEEPFRTLQGKVTKLLNHLQNSQSSTVGCEPHDVGMSSLVRGGLATALWNILSLGAKPTVKIIQRNSVWRMIQDYPFTQFSHMLNEINTIKNYPHFTDETQRFRAFICECLERRVLGKVLRALLSDETVVYRHYFANASSVAKCSDALDRLVGILEPLSSFSFHFVLDFELQYLTEDGNVRKSSDQRTGSL
ncbi:hypothetical protein P9112_012293 [Eukaryota sp. TZLM1-RC]